MSEIQTPATAPEQKPNTTKTPKRHGLLNKQQLIEIGKAGVVYGIVAADKEIFDRIKDDEIITSEFMTELGKDIEYIGRYTGGLTEMTVGGKLKTGAEVAARKVLLAKLHYVQSKARLKYIAKPGVLPEYCIGTNIDSSRVVLETAAANIINKLKSDTLPKVTAQHSLDLQSALDAYRKTKVEQIDQKGDVMTLRQQLSTLVESLSLRRRQLQHAADGDYPHTDPANAGVRSKLDLPADRPLNI